MVEQQNLKLIYSTKAPSQKTHRELKLSAQPYPKRLPGKNRGREEKRASFRAAGSQTNRGSEDRGREQRSRIRNPLRRCPANYSIPLKANSSHSVNGLPHPKLLHREL